MANRLTYVREELYNYLEEIQGYTIRAEFSIDSWKQDEQYIHLRMEGEDFDSQDYESYLPRTTDSDMILGAYVGFEAKNNEDFEKAKEEAAETVRKHLRTFTIKDFKDDDKTETRFSYIVPRQWQSVMRDNNYGLLYYTFILKFTLVSL